MWMVPSDKSINSVVHYSYLNKTTALTFDQVTKETCTQIIYSFWVVQETTVYSVVMSPDNATVEQSVACQAQWYLPITGVYELRYAEENFFFMCYCTLPVTQQVQTFEKMPIIYPKKTIILFIVTCYVKYYCLVVLLFTFFTVYSILFFTFLYNII